MNVLGKLQFLAALIVAAAYDSWEKLKGIKSALSTKQQVTEELKQARLAECPTCPVYYRPLQTCGSPLKKHDGVGERPGCFCYLPEAAGTLHNCWLFNRGRGGWPAELNSFPPEHE